MFRSRPALLHTCHVGYTAGDRMQSVDTVTMYTAGNGNFSFIRDVGCCIVTQVSYSLQET